MGGLGEEIRPRRLGGCFFWVSTLIPLIHTCALSSINPLAQLDAWHRQVQALNAHRADWMPWNY